MNTLRTNINKLVLPVVATGLAGAAFTACNPESDRPLHPKRNAGCAINFYDHQLAAYGEDGSADLIHDLAEAADLSDDQALEALSQENGWTDEDQELREGDKFVLIGQEVCNILKRNPEDPFYVVQLTSVTD